jgi:hypothetical protein
MVGSGSLEDLSHEVEVQVTFVISKNGKKRTIPVWFTVNEGKIELLPMYGLKTKWFVDVERSGNIELSVKDWKKSSHSAVVRDSVAVTRIKRRFSDKYGEDEVKKYYPTSEVALLVTL